MSTTTSTRARRGARVDPRIEQRRREVTRAAGRRRLRFLVAAVVGILAVGAAYGTTRTPMLDLDHVAVAGARETPLAAVATYGGLSKGMAMVDVDPGRVGRRLEAIPWIESATVRRKWPGTVVVTLRERVPAAAIARPDGKWAASDALGRVLVIEPSPRRGLVHVHGATRLVAPGGTVSPPVRAGVRVAAAMPPELRTVVGGVNVTPTGVELGLTAGKGVVRLGDASDVEEKLRAAVTVLRRVPPRQVSVLDVRVPRAPVLSRR